MNWICGRRCVDVISPVCFVSVLHLHAHFAHEHSTAAKADTPGGTISKCGITSAPNSLSAFWENRRQTDFILQAKCFQIVAEYEFIRSAICGLLSSLHDLQTF